MDLPELVRNKPTQNKQELFVLLAPSPPQTLFIVIVRRDLSSSSRAPDLQLAIVFLEDQSVGKTSIITRFMYDKFDKFVSVVSLSHCLFPFANNFGSRCRGSFHSFGFVRVLVWSHRSPDAVAFNALISGLASFCHPGPAIALLDELRLRGLCPDAYTFSSLVKACGSVWENEIVHGVCLKYGFSASAYVVSGLMENYAGGGEVGVAEKCFEDCEGVDNVVWVAVVSGYVWNGELDSAKELFVEMRGVGLEVNEYSMTAVLGALLDCSRDITFVDMH